MLTTLLPTLRNRLGRNPAEPAVPAKLAQSSSPQDAPVNGPTNPYVEARREWNERYGDYIHQAQHWRVMAIVCGTIALVAVVGVVYIGAQNKIIPYVVEVDKLGAAAAITRADSAAAVDQRVIKAYLARFVADWRTVTVDRQAQKSAIDRVYAMLPHGSVALGKVNDHFKANNPFSIGANRSVSVAVTSLLPLSDRTWQADWQEVTRNNRGEVEKNVRMKVSIIVGITPPNDERLVLINPLGVYITDLNWSQQL